MQAWISFYQLIGAASATLVGLLFVAISMNAGSSIGQGLESATRLAQQAYQNYATVLLIALLALFPETTVTSFARIALAASSLSAVWVLVRLIQELRKPTAKEYRATTLRQHVVSMLGFALLIFSLAVMAARRGDWRGLLAGALIVLTLNATTVAWAFVGRATRATMR